MRRQMGKIGRRMLAVTLSAVLLAASIPKSGIYANEKGNQTWEAVVYTELPEEETTRVEVFSQDGHLEHVEVSVEDFEDVPDEQSSVGGAAQKNEETKEGSNLPVSKQDYIALPAADQLNFEYRDLLNNGSDSENYCILIAGDGYTAGEQTQFLQTAQRIADYFMTRTPFNDENIKKKINIRAVCTVSNQTSVSMDPDNLYDTFFKSSFNNAGIERLVCIHDQNALDKVIQQYMPECNVPIVVCNSTVYGGSGGSVCVISDHEQATDIAFHEFGHTGGGLADEYWETTTDSTNGYEAPNRTSESDPLKCKWSKFIGVNGVGLYAFDENPAWYRPHQNCEMRYLNQEFCEVCKEQIRYVISNVIDNKVGENEVIYTADQLVDYANKVAAGAKTTNKTVTLANDITLTGTDNIAVMKEFNGTFNGNGHVIRGININSSSGTTGFIGTLGTNGTISNLNLESANIVGNGYYIGGIVGNNKGTIYQCSYNGYVGGSNGTGGIAGHMEGSGVIRDCYNSGTVYSSSQVAGGIVGWMDDGTVSNCFNYGSISVGNSWYGAICGYKPGGTVSNCYYLSGTANEGVAANGDNGAAVKTAAEFSNGTVTALLNSVHSVWKQGSQYPVFTYTSVPIEQQTTAQSGMMNVTVTDDSTWTTIGAWSYYFGSWNNSNGSYKGGNSVDDFTLTISDNNKSEWGIQAGLDNLPVQTGHTYRYTLNVTSNAAGVIGSKEDVSNSAMVRTNINSGTNTITGTFTASSDRAKLVLELATGISVGTTLEFTGFSFEDVTSETLGGEETTAQQQSGPIEVFGLMVSSSANNTITVVWGQNEEQMRLGQKYNIYMDSVLVLDNVACGQYDVSNIGAGNHKVTVTAVLNGKETSGVTADVDVRGENLTDEETTTESVTEAPTTRKFNAFEIIEAEDFASKQGGVVDTNGNASGGYNLGGITNGVVTQYDNVVFSENAGAFLIYYSSPVNVAQGNAEIYVDSMDSPAGTAVLTNNSSSWEGYGVLTCRLDKEIGAGTHRIFVKYVTTGSCYYVANIDYFKFIKASEVEETTEEITTEEETTTVKTIEGGIEINGYQVSAQAKGMRTVYSVDSTIDGKKVVSSGMVYSLVGYAEESDMYVGSTSGYVRSYQSTSAGKCSLNFSDSDNATSYAMTMRFATNEPSEYEAGWRIRAYAELSDGSYVYTNIYTYTIYEVAEYLYENSKMNSEAAHEYLYMEILSIVNQDYVVKEYNWSNLLIGIS